MTLEGILGGIAENPGKTDARTKYNSKTLVDTTEFIGELYKIDAGTLEGQDKYRKLTGLPTAGISDRRLGFEVERIEAEVGETFNNYIDSHAGTIIKELDEMTQTSIGYNFCPQEKSASKGYETARRGVYEAREKIKLIEEDKKAYVKAEIDKVPDYLKGIMARDPDKLCAIDAMDAKDNALGAIAKYGATKFLMDIYTQQVKTTKEIEEERRTAGEERKKLDRSITPGLDAEGRARHYEAVNKKEAELAKRNEEIKTFNQLRATIVQTAVATIKEKAVPKTP